jgi:glutathione S-transferase
MKLYDYRDCPYCQKVRVVLAEKELSYETVLVDLHKQEQKTPEFLRLNPFGKVPVLEDEELVVYDSTIINEYLEDEYPLPPLMPDDSAGRARVRLLEDYSDTSFLPRTSLVLTELARPEAERDAERLQRYQAEIGRGLAWLDSSLEGRDFLVGEFSIADIAFVPGVLILKQLGVELDPRWRNLVAWIARLRERPSIQAQQL